MPKLREMLGVIFALEKFHHYVYGYKTEVQTDHQPLVTIVKKPLYRASPRLQLMLLRLMRYDVFVKYVPGKLLYIPDILSRAPSGSVPMYDTIFEVMQLRVHQLMTHLQVSQSKLDVLRVDTANDDL